MGSSPRWFSDKGDVGEGWGALVGWDGWWRGDRERVVGRDVVEPGNGEGSGLHCLGMVRGVS